MMSSLRIRLSDLKVMIIDEMSMVSNDLLFYVHTRLNEIFGFVIQEPFARLMVLAVGDSSQLSPVGGRSVYSLYKNTLISFNAL